MSSCLQWEANSIKLMGFFNLYIMAEVTHVMFCLVTNRKCEPPFPVVQSKHFKDEAYEFSEVYHLQLALFSDF